MDAILVILALIILTIGLLGTVYPALPGLPIMFGGVFLLAYVGDFEVIGSTTLWVLGALTALGMLLDFVASMLGAKFTGASKEALWGTVIGATVGMFFGLPGLILGPLLGASAGELLARKDILRAGTVGIGTFLGYVAGVAAKLGIAVVMLITIVVQYGYHWVAH